MEMQEGALVAAWWNEFPEDLQTEILGWVPEESMNNRNRKQPRLLLCDQNPKMPCMEFCFYRRTWIKSCFNFSFLNDWALRHWVYEPICGPEFGIDYKQSVAGFLLVRPLYPEGNMRFRVCNPCTRSFIDIRHSDTFHQIRCVVAKENNNWRSDDAFKVVDVGYHFLLDVEERLVVQIYEPSKKIWNIEGYITEDIALHSRTQLIFWNGSFYTHWAMTPVIHNCGILGFTIPLEGNGSSATPIPVLLAPYPEMVPHANLFHTHRLFGPQLITCRSRLLLIAAMKIELAGEGEAMQIELGGEGEDEVELIMWEFKIEECAVPPTNTPSWKWVEISRMPSSICREWMNKFSPDIDRQTYLFESRCIGVGDHVCFVPSPGWAPSPVVDVLAYNLLDNTWNWLPSCPRSHRCGRQGNDCPEGRGRYIGTAFSESGFPEGVSPCQTEGAHVQENISMSS